MTQGSEQATAASTETIGAPPKAAGKPRSPYQRSGLWLFLQWWVALGFRLFFRAQVYGVDNVPKTGGGILAANHQSFLDPPLVGFPLKRPVSFMAKSELFENKYFGWLIRNLHAFPIRQGKGDRAAIVETVKRLQEGHLLNIYPEGTRSETGRMEPLQTGIALIIRKAGVPVIPVAIAGSFDAWPKGSRFFKPGHEVKVCYGPPLTLHHLPAAEIVAQLERVLRTMVEDLETFPSGTAGEPITARRTPD